jgi:hypothetical protein
VVEAIVLRGKWLELGTLKGKFICMFHEHGFKNLNREYYIVIDYKDNRRSVLCSFLHNL